MYTRSASLIAVSVVLPLLAAVAVAFRLLVRKNTKIGYGADDWIILAALIIQFGSAGITIWSAVDAGEGDSLQNIIMNPEEASNYAMFLFVGPLIFAVTIALIKISILTLYKRIFITKSFHVLCNIMMVLTAGWFLASFFGQIFSSKPVSLGWQSPVHNAMNYPAFLVSIATINTALDLATVCLPLLVILKLNMTFNRKVLVSGMFLLGLFCIIASAVRLYYFVYLLQEANNPVLETSVTVDDTIWSFIEPCMSIVAACLPTLAPVFKGGRDLGSIVRSVRSVFSLRTIDSQKDQIRSKGSKESKGSNTQETREAKRAWQKLNTGTSPSNHIAGGSEVELDEIRPLYDPASGITVQTTLTSEVSKDGLV